MDDDMAIYIARARLLALLAEASVGGARDRRRVDRVLAPVAQQLAGRGRRAAARADQVPRSRPRCARTVFSTHTVSEKHEA